MTGVFVDGIHGTPYIAAPLGSVMGNIFGSDGMERSPTIIMGIHVALAPNVIPKCDQLVGIQPY